MIYAIGDIHGMLDKLITLYESIIGDINRHQEKSKIIFLGDYIDRGPNSKAVLDFLINLNDSELITHIFIKGNHENMWISAMNCNVSYYNSLPKRMFMSNGGIETMKSFNMNNPYEFFANEYMNKYSNWIDKLQLFHLSEKYLFVHAAFDMNKDINNQEVNMLWERTDKRIFPYAKSPYIVIHGHTPTLDNNPHVDINEINVDTGACFDGKLTAVRLPDDSTDWYDKIKFFVA